MNSTPIYCEQNDVNHFPPLLTRIKWTKMLISKRFGEEIQIRLRIQRRNKHVKTRRQFLNEPVDMNSCREIANSRWNSCLITNLVLRVLPLCFRHGRGSLYIFVRPQEVFELFHYALNPNFSRNCVGTQGKETENFQSRQKHARVSLTRRFFQTKNLNIGKFFLITLMTHWKNELQWNHFILGTPMKLR